MAHIYLWICLYSWPMHTTDRKHYRLRIYQKPVYLAHRSRGTKLPLSQQQLLDILINPSLAISFQNPCILIEVQLIDTCER
ncbi:hypothetical protein D3C71_1858170 [compost metagenome]